VIEEMELLTQAAFEIIARKTSTEPSKKKAIIGGSKTPKANLVHLACL
jgi:hypothetical protein